MSVATGVLVWALASLTGLQFAAEWGVIAFALNYIPFIGPFIATVFPTLFALAQFASWQAALAVFACLNVIQFVIGSYIEPRVSGSALAISPFVVLFAVFLWTFLWGLFGAFIGVPITIAVLTFCAQHPSSRWLSDLLGGSPRGAGGQGQRADRLLNLARGPRDLDALGRQQAEPPFGTGRQRVDMEAGGLVVGRLHDRRRRRDDPHAAALADPVDVAMPVHRHDPAAQGSGADARTSVPLISAVPIRSEKAAAGFGIFHEVVVQGHDPARRESAGQSRPDARACSAETRPSALVKEKCVSALELSRTTPSPSSVSGGSTIGKASAQTRASPSRKAQRSGIGECRDGGAVGRQRVRQRLAELVRSRGSTTRTLLSLHCGDGRQRAHLAQALAGARRKIEPRRIGTVDDVDVVIARQQERSLRRAPDTAPAQSGTRPIPPSGRHR